MSLTVAETEKIANDFLKEYRGNIAVTMRVAQDPEDLYGPDAKDQGIQGSYHPARGLFTLASRNLHSAQEARTVIRHELLGHYGLNTFAPDEKRDLLHRVLETRQEPSLKPFWDRVDRDYADQPELFKAEEVFAFVAEDEPRFASRAWDKTRAVFARALRTAGLTQSPLTLPELRETAQSVATGIRRGTRLQQTFPQHDQAQFRKETRMSEKKSYRDQVVEELLTHIEAGTAPWQKPWDPGKVRLGPFNPVSGANYRGINAIWLETRGHDDPRWMTYRQATGQDAQVRKGEKGTKIEYWKWTDKRPMLDEDGKPILDDDGKKKTARSALPVPRSFMPWSLMPNRSTGWPRGSRRNRPSSRWNGPKNYCARAMCRSFMISGTGPFTARWPMKFICRRKTPLAANMTITQPPYTSLVMPPAIRAAWPARLARLARKFTPRKNCAPRLAATC
jgi:hypothetical protein